MLRYLMISLLTALTLILLTQSLVGAAECDVKKIADSLETFWAGNKTDYSATEP